MSLRYPNTPILSIYVLKQNRVIVTDEMHEKYIQVKLATVKTLCFRIDHLVKHCKLRSTCSLGISLIRVYTVAIPSAHCCRTTIIVGQGPAVLAAGAGWKLFDCLGNLFKLKRGFARK